MEESIRRLAAGDVLQVAELETEARASLVDQRGGNAHLAEVGAVGDWTALVGRDDHPVWVSTIDGVVVGYLEVELRPPATVVRQVYVHPEARELGFGDGMLATAMQSARDAGCTVVEGTALPGDRDTKNLYERAGITARKIIVSKSL
jgi:GNAT superfamily N-acetyltransferase